MNINKFSIICWLATVVATAQVDVVDFQKVDATILPDAAQKTISGEARYTFTMLQNADSVFLDAHQMNVIEVNPKDSIQLRTDKDKIWLYNDFQSGETYQVQFGYEATPRQALYFFGDQIWTQGQGKDTSHWLPSIDNVTDKMIFNITIAASKHQRVLANGTLQKRDERDSLTYWKYQMKHPMSSYLVAIAVGLFEKEEIKSASDVPLELYFLPEQKDKVEPTYRYTQDIFDFLESEIGIPYPWQNYKQVPVRDFLYAGMENTTLTIFSDAFVVDSIGFVDKNYVNVNAHELAHQWFGNLVTAATSQHHWLQEGFATYYALIAERNVFGDDYFYWQLYQSAEQLTELSDEGKGEPLLSTGASSLTYYQKGAWALHILREQIGGNAFRKAVQNYLSKYAYQSVTTDDFLDEVSQASGQDLTDFRKNWLEQSAFKSYEALQSLKKSDFIVRYLDFKSLQPKPLSEKKERLYKALGAPVNDYLGQEAVYQLHDEPIDETLELYEKAFETKNVLVRQAIAFSLSEIPKELISHYETLLHDNSYLTREIALLNLWMQFPEKRSVYLDATKTMVGFADKNIRILWLALAIATQNYNDTQKNEYFKELSQYTSPRYGFEVRENAFRYLMQLELFTDQNLADLINGCLHPNWRFAKAMREILDLLIENPKYRNRLDVLKKQLSEEEVLFLERQMK